MIITYLTDKNKPDKTKKPKENNRHFLGDLLEDVILPVIDNKTSTIIENINLESNYTKA